MKAEPSGAKTALGVAENLRVSLVDQRFSDLQQKGLFRRRDRKAENKKCRLQKEI